MEKVLDELSFEAPDLKKKASRSTRLTLNKQLADIVKNQDLSRYICKCRSQRFEPRKREPRFGERPSAIFPSHRYLQWALPLRLLLLVGCGAPGDPQPPSPPIPSTIGTSRAATPERRAVGVYAPAQNIAGDACGASCQEIFSRFAEAEWRSGQQDLQTRLYDSWGRWRTYTPRREKFNSPIATSGSAPR